MQGQRDGMGWMEMKVMRKGIQGFVHGSFVNDPWRGERGKHMQCAKKNLMMDGVLLSFRG